MTHRRFACSTGDVALMERTVMRDRPCIWYGYPEMTLSSIRLHIVPPP